MTNQIAKKSILHKRDFSKMQFKDGLQSFTNSIMNKRNALNTNTITSAQMTYVEMRALYKDGLGRKIVDIKSDYALRNSLVFKKKEDEETYIKNYKKYVNKAFKYCIAFGRGVIVILEVGIDPAEPLSKDFKETRNWKLQCFSGDLVTVSDYTYDMMQDNFLRPNYYTIGLGGRRFHYSRVIDFTYKDPDQFSLPTYQFGGVSEFQYLRDQLINDGVVQRASASILEKNASFFYKIMGFKDALENDSVDGAPSGEAGVVSYVSASENSRSIYGAGIVDGEDEVVNITQSLTDLDKVNNIAVQRLAMYSGIPVAFLVGEDVNGLNATGKVEQTQFGYMLKDMQDTYAEPPINRFLSIMGMEPITFKESADLTSTEQAEYDGKVIANAKLITEMGGDGEAYLIEKGILKQPSLLSVFKENADVQ